MNYRILDILSFSLPGIWIRNLKPKKGKLFSLVSCNCTEYISGKEFSPIGVTFLLV